MVNPTWWLIPPSKWVITTILSELTLIIPFITKPLTKWDEPPSSHHQTGTHSQLRPPLGAEGLALPRHPLPDLPRRGSLAVRHETALCAGAVATWHFGVPGGIGFRVFKTCWGHGDFTDLNCLPKPTKMEKYGVHHQKLMGNLGLKHQQQVEHRNLHSKDGHVLGRETMAKKPDGL